MRWRVCIGRKDRFIIPEKVAGKGRVEKVFSDVLQADIVEELGDVIKFFQIQDCVAYSCRFLWG
jgi:hypothetical protein